MRIAIRRRACAVLVVLATVVVAGCSGSSQPNGDSSRSSSRSSSSSAPAESIVIGGGSSAETTLVANIYAVALRAKNVTVTLQPAVSARASYVAAMKSGSINLTPEYSGALLRYLNPAASQVSSADVYSALQAAIPDPLTVLDQSPAQHQDQIVVAAATATKYSLKTIADLAPVAATLTFGGDPAFATRPDGRAALRRLYGVSFASSRSLDAGGELTVNALKNGQIEVADLPATSPAIAADGFVVLGDPKNEFAAENVVPLITKSKATPSVTATLNAISAKLDTAALSMLNAQVVGGKESLDTVAHAWLKSAGVI